MAVCRTLVQRIITRERLAMYKSTGAAPVAVSPDSREGPSLQGWHTAIFTGAR